MPAASTTTHRPLLKSIYSREEIMQIMTQKSAFAGLVAKKFDMKGIDWNVSLGYSNIAGRSATFSDALADKDPSKNVRFACTRVRDYAVFSVDNELIAASDDPKAAIARALEFETKRAFNALAISMSSALYRNGGGSVGLISSGSTVSSTTITLSNANDIVNFEVGNYVQLANTDGTSGSLLGGGAKLQITAVDEDNGTLTANAAWNSITGGVLAGTTQIFIAGDFGAKMQGLPAWVPSSAPSATAFFGVDRSVSPSRLGGIRVAGTASLPIEQACQKAVQRAFRAGAKISHIFLNDLQYLELVLSLGSRVQYTSEINQFGVKWEGLQMPCFGGTVRVYPDAYCPADVGWALQLDTWVFASAGEFPMFLNKDGKEMLDETSADALQGRVGGYFNLICYAPGYNARFPLAVPA